MQDYLSDQIVNLNILFGNGPEPKIPTVGSVTYTLLDHSGSPITGYVDVPITTGATDFSATISIPAIVNDIDPLKDFERRTVMISFTSNGTAYGQRIQYRLVPTLNYTVTPKQVRSFIGIEDDELSDDEVDLFVSYLMIAKEVGVVVLEDALTSGTLLEVNANNAILAVTVLGVVPSLMTRVTQSEKNGIMGFDRIKITNFDAILAAAGQLYADSLGILLGLDSTDFTGTLIVTTQDADPITG